MKTGKQLNVGDPCWIKTASGKPSDTLYKITSVASDGFGCLIAEIKHDGTLYASQPWDTHMLIKNKAAEDAAANMFNKAVLDTFFGKIA